MARVTVIELYSATSWVNNTGEMNETRIALLKMDMQILSVNSTGESDPAPRSAAF